MNWHSAAEFAAMGGYGLYVWGAYSVSALLIAIEIVQVAQRRRRALAAVAATGTDTERGRA